MSRIIDLPSGAKIEGRSLTGKESKILSDKDLAKSGLFLDKILEACTVSVMDFGPYQSSEKLNWRQALLGDRFYALLQIRILSLGADYCFKLQCQEEACRERFDYGLNLNDLPVKRLSDVDRTAFASGNEFITVDCNGRMVTYRLPIGQDELLAAKSTNTFDSAFIQSLLQRIVSIEGVDDKRKYLEDMGWGDLLQLLEAFDEHNCGVETDFSAECPKCGAIQDVRLPFGRGFLLPSTKLGVKKT